VEVEAMQQRMIVVGFDGSAGGRRALDWAVGQARHSDATVEVVRAWEPPWTEDESDRSARDADLARVDRELGRDVALALSAHEQRPVVSYEVVQGPPVETLVEAATAADMLVLGSHGHSHLLTALMGSTSEGCIRAAPCPVVVVPVPVPDEERARIPQPARRTEPSQQT
jgi:nucleotide-binding universal stress UspA family protein